MKVNISPVKGGLAALIVLFLGAQSVLASQPEIVEEVVVVGEIVDDLPTPVVA